MKLKVSKIIKSIFILLVMTSIMRISTYTVKRSGTSKTSKKSKKNTAIPVTSIAQLQTILNTNRSIIDKTQLYQEKQQEPLLTLEQTPNLEQTEVNSPEN